MSECMLELLVHPSAEGAVLDWLLDDHRVPGFHSMEVRGHGAAFSELAVAEQVAGRQRQVLFRAQLAEDVARAVIAAMREELTGVHIRYAILSIRDTGHTV